MNNLVNYQTHYWIENDSLTMYNEENDIDSEKKIYDMDTGANVQQHNFFLADKDDMSNDGVAWSEKSVKHWSRRDSAGWLLNSSKRLGQPYRSISDSLCVPGQDLISMTKDDFKLYDEVYGERLYDILHSEHLSEFLDIPCEDKFSRTNNLSDVESDSSDKVRPKRSPGRPRVSKCNKTSNTYGKLWQFIVQLLHNEDTCPKLIRWEDYSQAQFRFMRNDEVAKKWGARKGNTKMTYEKLSRAMR
ncbi:ETS homologous factor-like [Cephus cinctus]|uniref:ETS homologous factor-like n=1 Tax=Cephus cinctus TaxID=211228 RepID=A0AAJ7C8N5_CEPCN|nr:ETS homologous factor-like [Cephus cinctus]